MGIRKAFLAAIAAALLIGAGASAPLWAQATNTEKAAPKKFTPKSAAKPQAKPKPSLPAAKPAPLLEPPLPAPPPPIDSQRAEMFVDGYMASLMQRERIAGGVVAIVYNNEILLAKGYGIAGPDGRAPDPERTLVRLGPITQTFVWTALLQQVEIGRIGLDDPINRHLPDYLQIPDYGHGEPIRIRHLMSHSAGFENRIAKFIVRDPALIPSGAASLLQNRPRRVRLPGRAAVYNAYNAALAGHIIALATHEDLEELVEAQIFDPLGMARTTLREPDRTDRPPLAAAQAADLAAPFAWKNGRLTPQPFEYVRWPAAGSASSTAMDMSRFMRALLNDGGTEAGRILAPSFARRFAGAAHLANGADGAGWASGFMQMRTRNSWRAFGHSGTLRYSAADMQLFPELDLGVFIAVTGENGQVVQGAFAASLVEHYFPRASYQPLRPAATIDPALIQTLAGRYLSDGRAYTSAERLFCLIRCIMTVRAAENGVIIKDIDGLEQLYLFADTKRTSDGALHYRFFQAPAGALLTIVDRPGQPLRVNEPRGIARYTRIGLLERPLALALAALLAFFTGAMAFGLGFWRAIWRWERARNTRYVSRAMTLSGGAWMVAAATLAIYYGVAIADPWVILENYPDPYLVTLTSAAALAAAMAILGVLLTIWHWSRADWSIWRRIRILATLAALLAPIPVFYVWRILWPNF